MSLDQTFSENSSFLSKNFSQDDPSFMNNQSYINCELESDFPKDFFLQRVKDKYPPFFQETVLNPKIIKVKQDFVYLTCIYDLV